jgi:hypothetical protein
MYNAPAMLPRLLDRWHRRLDLDQVRPKKGKLVDYIGQVFEFIDDGSRRSIELLLRYILLQALVDHAIGVHFYYDEPGIRMLYCLAVPPEPASPAGERVWYEMVPPPVGIAPRFFERLRWYAGLRPGATKGRLSIRLDGQDLFAPVIAPCPDDIRIFFGSERPPIRPKLGRHFDELGLPRPE